MVQQVWDQGWTVQVIQPQRVVSVIADLLRGLEELFQCTVGSNAYLTPAKTQGLAPHWDDIEAMIVHLEGIGPKCLPDICPCVSVLPYIVFV